MNNTLITSAIALFVLVFVVIWLINLFYLRGESNRAYVRTGFGGRKVIMDGGMFVLPVLHRIMPISLGLSKVTIQVEKEAALITADRMRVDVDAEFFLRVKPEAESVALAAATLGALTNRPEDLATFYESEFLGALRAVASGKELNALHEQRAEVVTTLASHIAPVLAANGLELSSVAIRNLDQTPLEYFNPANRFDAEGLTKLIDTVEERRQLRNAIEQKSAVSIREANLAAEKETLALERESQMAKLEQEREVEIRKAAQSAEIAKEQSTKSAEAEAARIAGVQSTNQREIAAREEVERARYASEKALDESRIQREQELRRLEIEREKFVDIQKLETAIEVLAKSVEEADAQVKAEKQLAAAAKSKEIVSTAKVLGAAEREAAVSKVDIERETSAEQLRAAVAAEAERLRNEAENVLTEDARAGRLRAQLIAKLESVIAETVKPIEKIDGIKMVHMSGGHPSAGRTPTDEVIDSALRYRVQAPIIDELMKEIGVEGANVSKMGDIMRAAKDAQSLAKDVKPSGVKPSEASTMEEKDD